MKRTHLIIIGSALLAVALAGCGGSSDDGMGGGGGPPPPTSQNLDTAGVLAIARVTSETAPPLDVNDGAVTITGTAEAPALEINAP